jgi:hypothetical protein
LLENSQLFASAEANAKHAPTRNRGWDQAGTILTAGAILAIALLIPPAVIVDVSPR